MRLALTTIDMRNRTQIPEQVKQALRLGPGDIIEWVERGDGVFEVRQAGDDNKQVHQG